jgi:hypothetical protein
MTHIVAIETGKIALGKTEVMDSVKKVCFSRAVPATDPDDPLVKIKSAVRIILELVKINMTDIKHSLQVNFYFAWLKRRDKAKRVNFRELELKNFQFQA